MDFACVFKFNEFIRIVWATLHNGAACNSVKLPAWLKFTSLQEALYGLKMLGDIKFRRFVFKFDEFGLL